MQVAELDVHRKEAIHRAALRHLRADGHVTADQKEKILEFAKVLQAEGLDPARITKYVQKLGQLAVLLGKPWAAATKGDVQRVIGAIEAREYAEWTKHDYRVTLQRFFQWLQDCEKRVYPEEVRWISSTVKRNSEKLPDDLLTVEEVQRLAEAMGHLRDKTFILALYESGCRPEEFLTLRVRHVQFDEYGAVLLVQGKTAMRRVRVITYAPLLAQWLDNHPRKGDPDAPLSVMIGTWGKNAPMSYPAARMLLAAAQRKVQPPITKRLNLYIFRHSQATELHWLDPYKNPLAASRSNEGRRRPPSTTAKGVV